LTYEKIGLFTVFHFKNRIPDQPSQGFSLYKNIKTVGKCIAPPGM
jgi:hypothetical protein